MLRVRKNVLENLIRIIYLQLKGWQKSPYIVTDPTYPKYLSTDNDPLFLFSRWQANLRILEIEEIKSVPGNPVSHPFIERVIKSVRTEYLDHMLFFSAHDLQNKLDQFKEYYNETRAHSSLEMKTPEEMATDDLADRKIVSLDDYRWQMHCRGLYKLPIAA
jgi:transposase InsO family protein